MQDARHLRKLHQRDGGMPARNESDSAVILRGNGWARAHSIGTEVLASTEAKIVALRRVPAGHDDPLPPIFVQVRFSPSF